MQGSGRNSVTEYRPATPLGHRLIQISGHLRANDRTLLHTPHPEQRRVRRVSKDEGPSVASWFSRRCEASSGDRAFLNCTVRDGLAPLGLLGCCASSP